MAAPLIVAAGVGLAGSAMSAYAQKQAGEAAADATTAANEAAMAEQQRQFDTMRALAQPYVDAGGTALGKMNSLIGLNGDYWQDKAISSIEQGQEYQHLVDSGEDAILANAAATGGLRGGNTQAALAEFRPALLSNLINQRYSQYQGLANSGQNAAVGVGNNAMTLGANNANALANTGQANAASALATGQANANLASGISGAVGQIAGAWQPGVPNGGLF